MEDGFRFIRLSKLENSGEPPYMQIIRQFKQLILQGKINHGDTIPSRRAVAVHIGVNPMTVQRAFTELEAIGLIHTPPNAKSVVCISEDMRRRLRAEAVTRDAAALAENARAMGIGCDALLEIIKNEYGRPQA